MKKEITIIIISLLTILHFFVIDRGTVITNGNYNILWMMEIPIVFIVVYFFIAKKHSKENIIRIIIATVVTIGFSKLLITPLNNTLLIKFADKTKEIVLSGKVISATRTQTGKSQAISYEVNYQLENGTIESFLVPEKERIYNYGEFIDNNLILNNNQLYEKIKLVGYKSPLGFYFIRFNLE